MDKRQREDCTKPKPDDLQFIHERPDHINQVRYVTKAAVGHFVCYLINHDEGAARLVMAQARNAGMSKKQAYEEMQTLVYVLYTVATDWVISDEYFKTFEGHGMDACYRLEREEILQYADAARRYDAEAELRDMLSER